MAHAVIWKYIDSEQETYVLIGHPGTYAETPEEAVTEGRKTIEALAGHDLTPLVVVETDEDLHDDVYDCEEIYLGPEDNDELFFNISGMGKWSGHDWWPPEYR